MAVHLRLKRMGAKKRPVYAVVAADHRAPRDGRYIEKIGHYNPLLKAGHEQRFVVKIERIKYWLQQGAQPTERIARLLAAIGELPKFSPNKRTKRHLPKEKAQQRLAEKEEARKAAEQQSSESDSAAE